MARPLQQMAIVHPSTTEVLRSWEGGGSGSHGDRREQSGRRPLAVCGVAESTREPRAVLSRLAMLRVKRRALFGYNYRKVFTLQQLEARASLSLSLCFTISLDSIRPTNNDFLSLCVWCAAAVLCCCCAVCVHVRVPGAASSRPRPAQQASIIA